MRLVLAPALTIIFALAACSEFPELDDTTDHSLRRAAYPDLVPVEDIYAGIPDNRIDAITSGGIEARVARLKARAARLRGTVIDDATRSRMTAGVN